MRRLGKPAEIAAGVAYLASDDASFITDLELYIDGGSAKGRVRRSGWAWPVFAGAGWAVAVYGTVVRPWHLRWGATEEEVRRPLPGDELVATLLVAGTRAITIATLPERVWPWLVQQGYGRAGWYSYRVDNAFRRSPDRIVPELQQIAVGDVLRTGKQGGFTVVALDDGHYWAGLIASEFGQVSVVQLVEPAADGAARLLIRFRAGFAPRLAAWAFWLAFDPGDFLFMRREMLGIKRRAERSRT